MKQHHEPGPSAIPELEALELTQKFAKDFDIPIEEARPCIATFYHLGVPAEREPHAFALAVELHSLDVCPEGIEEGLREYSSHLGQPLANSEIMKFKRKLMAGRYHRQRCDNPLLHNYCIGECPYRNRHHRGSSKHPILSTFFDLGWPRALSDPYASMIYLGIHKLRILLSYEPSARFPFNYTRLERISGVSRSLISARLNKLRDVGLIAELEIGNPWGGERKRTRVRLNWPMPSPEASCQRAV